MRTVGRSARVLSFLTVLGLISFPGCGDGDVNGPPPILRVGFSPSSVSTTDGDLFSVDVVVENVTDLFGAAFEVTFNGAVLEATASAQGDLLGSNQLYFEHLDSTSVSVGCTRKLGDGSVSGSGTLATIIFRAAAPGNATVTIEESELSLERQDETVIEVEEVGSCSVLVE